MSSAVAKTGLLVVVSLVAGSYFTQLSAQLRQATTGYVTDVVNTNTICPPPPPPLAQTLIARTPIVQPNPGHANANQEFEEDETKQKCEMGFWKSRFERENKDGVKQEEKKMDNSLYVKFYTTYFNLSKSFYDNKKFLDIGCGPRGSLEWADNAKQRICADPLVMDYGSLNIGAHDMLYIKAGAEKLPFPENSLDVVASINNLDHITNLDAGVTEITRVLKTGGAFILIVEVHPKPTICEPLALPWNLSSQFSEFDVVQERHHESANWANDLSGDTTARCKLANGLFGTPSVLLCPRFNHEDKTPRDGWMALHMRKR